MAAMKWVALVALFVPLQVYAGDNSSRALSRFELQQGLFAVDTRADPSPGFLQPEGFTQKKSTGLAAIYSLLLPGMGELYAGGFESGKYFLIAEGVLWLTYAALEIHGNQLRDDSRAFAQSHAGVNPSGKDEQYFVDIGNFIDVYEYNDKKLRDREPEKLYNPVSNYAWRWDSDLSRAQFRDQRIASENMYNNRKFVFAAILINHVGSAINAVRSTIIHNRSVNEALDHLDIHTDVQGGMVNPHGIMLTVSRRF